MGVTPTNFLFDKSKHLTQVAEGCDPYGVVISLHYVHCVKKGRFFRPLKLILIFFLKQTV